MAAAITARSPTPLFITWLAVEITICSTRLAVLIVARRRALRCRPTPTDLNLILSIAWNGSVGYGALISVATGDWVGATLACVSAGAMVGGICFRNFSAPRLCGAMIVLSLGPTIPGALLAAQPLMLVLLFQVPMYLAAMTMACFKLNRMLIATMPSEPRTTAAPGTTNSRGSPIGPASSGPWRTCCRDRTLPTRQWPCFISISTPSRRSTTPAVTQATGCWKAWPSACAACCAWRYDMKIARIALAAALIFGSIAAASAQGAGGGAGAGGGSGAGAGAGAGAGGAGSGDGGAGGAGGSAAGGGGQSDSPAATSGQGAGPSRTPSSANPGATINEPKSRTGR